MRFLLAITLAAVLAGAAENQAGCAACAQKAVIPATNETVAVGRIENIVPIAVTAVLGCETCTEKAVAFALEHGSTAEEVSRALDAIAGMKKLDCFRQQFGPDAATRLEKPLAAARRALAAR